jgi:putative transcriptional regulator
MKPNRNVDDGRERRRTARSDAFEAIHSAASSLHAVGAIDKTTMREFDAACLATPDLSAEDVKNIRLSANVSQEVFARYLGTNKSTVQKWESADNRPSAMAQKLLMAVKKHGLDVLS